MSRKKSFKQTIASEFGLKINSNNRDTLQKEVALTHLKLLNNLKQIVDLVALLYAERPMKFNAIKDDMESLLGVSLSARDRISLNRKIINLLNVNLSKKEYPPTDSHNSSEKRSLYFELLKYQSFHASSKLEDVDVKYPAASLQSILKKYKRQLEVENE